MQGAFSFMTFQGASYGDNVVAANAVLMSFLMIISYGMDGFAYAMEAMVGKAIGARDSLELRASIIGSFFWSGLICVLLTGVFMLYGQWIVDRITNIEAVRFTAYHYLPWLVAMPLCSMWCFLLDGIFIGATKGKEMRNGMLISVVCFFSLFYMGSSWNNHALWAAMIGFMLMRGISLAWIFYRQSKQHRFLYAT